MLGANKTRLEATCQHLHPPIWPPAPVWDLCCNSQLRTEPWGLLAQSQGSPGRRDGVVGKGRLPHSGLTPGGPQEGRV